MEIAKRFLEYAAAFEQTYEDDDWSRLEAYFTLDAAYIASGGPPLGGRWEGRDALIAQLRESVEGLDRRFDERTVELTGAPKISDETIEFGWRGSYRKAGLPDLVFGGTERATFEGDRIRLLEDEMDEGVDREIMSFLEKHLAATPGGSTAGDSKPGSI